MNANGHDIEDAKGKEGKEEKEGELTSNQQAWRRWTKPSLSSLPRFFVVAWPIPVRECCGSIMIPRPTGLFPIIVAL